MKLKFPQKMKLTVGVAAGIGIVFWMRELASWRPQTVAKVGFDSVRLRLSRDGERLLVTNPLRFAGVIVNAESGFINTNPDQRRDFEINNGLRTFPRVWINYRNSRFVISVSPQQNIGLKALIIGQNYRPKQVLEADMIEGLRFSWFKPRREVYCELNGEIWIWDWNNGKLKKRVRYAKSSQKGVFSPDGKWFCPWNTLPKMSKFCAVTHHKVGNG